MPSSDNGEEDTLENNEGDARFQDWGCEFIVSFCSAPMWSYFIYFDVLN